MAPSELGEELRDDRNILRWPPDPSTLDALLDPQQLAFSVNVRARTQVDPKGRYSSGGHRDPQVAISDALCVGTGVAGDAPSQRR